VLFLGGVQLMSIGVVGRYLAHVHDQVLERPLYLVSRVIPRRQDDGVLREPRFDERRSAVSQSEGERPVPPMR
jgi:hypothetical protein